MSQILLALSLQGVLVAAHAAVGLLLVTDGGEEDLVALREADLTDDEAKVALALGAVGHATLL